MAVRWLEPQFDAGEIAREINALLAQYNLLPVEIATIEYESEDVGDPHWTAHLESGFCITLKKQIEEGVKSVVRRESDYEHNSHTGMIKFRPNKIMPYCTDTDCSAIRWRKGFPKFGLSSDARQILFPLDIPHIANDYEPLNGGGDERALVLSYFPEDAALWPANADTWRLGGSAGRCEPRHLG